MDYFVIGDEDTVLGFRYAGVPGRVVDSPAEARAALAEQRASGEASVLIITEEIARAVADAVNEIRFVSRMPIIVEIPGPAGPLPGRVDLLSLITEAMGLKL